MADPIVTTSEVFGTMDYWAAAYNINDSVSSLANIALSAPPVYGNGTSIYGTGNYNYISGVGKPISSISNATVPLQVSTQVSLMNPLFAAMRTWTGFSTIDAYLTAANATPFTALAKYNSAIQYYWTNGQNPLAPGILPTQQMTSTNVMPPVVQMGVATITGSDTVVASDRLDLCTTNNGVQVISFGGATGGTAIITFGGAVTAGIAWNAIASTVASDLNGLTPIGTGGVTVVGGSGLFVVQATPTWTAANPGILFGNFTITSALTGTTSTPNVDTNPNNEQILTITATGGNFSMYASGYNSGTIAHDANAAAIQTALNNIWGAGNVTVSGTGPFLINFVGVLQNQYIPVMGINQGTLSSGNASIYISQIGSQQGSAGAANINAVVTTDINGTCAATITCNGFTSAGASATGFTLTATLDNDTAGTVVEFTNGSSHRVSAITAVAVAGTATAGVVSLQILSDR